MNLLAGKNILLFHLPLGRICPFGCSLLIFLLGESRKGGGVCKTPTDRSQQINSTENDWRGNLLASLEREEQFILTSLSPPLPRVNIDY